MMPYTLIGKEKAAAEFGKQDTIYARMLFFMGSVYYKNNQLDSAEQFYKEAIKIQKVKIPNTRIYASSLNQLGTLYRQRGDYEKSKQYYQQVLQISSETTNKSSNFHLAGIVNILMVYYILGEYDSLKIKTEIYITICQQCSKTKTREYSVLLELLAFYYIHKEDFVTAIPLYEEVITIRKSILGSHSSDYGISLANYAQLYVYIKQYQQAILLLLEALSIFKSQYGEYSLEYLKVLNNIGLAYFNANDYKKAKTYYLDAYKISKEILSPSHPTYALMLNNLGALYNELGNLDSNKYFLQEAYKIKKKQLPTNENLYSLAHTINNLANFYADIKNYKKAETLQKEALDLYQQLVGKRHSDYLMSLHNLALFYFHTQRYEDSWSCTIKNLEINTHISLDIPLSKIDSNWLKRINQSIPFNQLFLMKALYHTLALLEIKATPIMKQQQLWVTGYVLELLEKQRSSFTIKADKMKELEESKYYIETALMIVKKLPKPLKTPTFIKQVFQFLQYHKSILLLDAIKDSKTFNFQSLPDSLFERENDLKEKKTYLQAQFYQANTARDSAKILSKQNAINLAIDQFLNLLKDKYPKYHTLKYQNITVKAEALQKLLPPKTLLLEYFVSETLIYCFVLNQDSIHICYLDISQQKLQQKTTLLRQALSDYEFIRNQPKTAREQYTKTAHWFYKNLVAPALDSQENINQLIIVPDHCLNHIPFEVFLSQASDTLAKDYKNLNYLLNDYSISYNYSATLLKENINNTPKQTNYKLLACAGYYTHQDSSLMTLRKPYLVNQRNQFKQLKSAEQEVAYLQAGFEGHFLTAEKANERSFKAIAPNYGVIHLAMHGRSDTLRPILSSLVFTENRDSVEDNFLQAYEISRLDLQAQLVVLSACETGYGIFEQGEGVLSLARSFMYAGVPSLVVSLWSVDDQSTALLMQFFYQHLAEGLPKDQALRQAKLDFLAQADARTMHPFFWASFIQLGHTKSIFLDKKGASGTEVLLLMAFITLILSGIFYYQKKYFS